MLMTCFVFSLLKKKMFDVRDGAACVHSQWAVISAMLEAATDEEH